MMKPLKSPIFTVTCRVLYGDTDAGKVVYNANYLRYFEKGRTELMRQWVASYREIEAQGIVLPVTEAFTRYKSPAFYDDLLTVETSISDLRKFSCKFNYRILRHEQTEEKSTLIAKGYTIHAAVTQEGRLTTLPEKLAQKLAAIIKGNIPTEQERN